MDRCTADRLIGIWKHPQGGWEIKYSLNGKHHSEYRRDEREAKLRGSFWKETLANKDGNDLGVEHPVLYWDRKAREAADLAIKNPGDKDIQATCKSLAQLISAGLRCARYFPAPSQSITPDSSPITGDVSNMTSKEMEALIGVPNKTSTPE